MFVREKIKEMRRARDRCRDVKNISVKKFQALVGQMKKTTEEVISKGSILEQHESEETLDEYL